jgi:pyruvate kinase
MEYKIIATLGPSSSSEATWLAMLLAGATGFRLNTSHLSLAQINEWLERLNTFIHGLETRPYLALDLQGSKWRLGQFTSFELQEGETIELVYGVSADNPHVLPVPHKDFFSTAETASGEIILNDARSRLLIETAGKDWLKARVIQGGMISANKGITVPNHKQRIEVLGEKDRAVYEKTLHLDFIHYAISYVKDAVEMERYRVLFGKEAHLIAKLERQPAIREAQSIAAFSNELWLCRGDLGAELGLKGMAEAVALVNLDVNNLSRPMFMAGQVLEHLTHHETATRSEICFLYDTLQRGYQGVVLSDETAIGRDPVGTCRTAAVFKSEK